MMVPLKSPQERIPQTSFKQQQEIKDNHEIIMKLMQENDRIRDEVFRMKQSVSVVELEKQKREISRLTRILNDVSGKNSAAQSVFDELRATWDVVQFQTTVVGSTEPLAHVIQEGYEAKIVETLGSVASMVADSHVQDTTRRALIEELEQKRVDLARLRTDFAKKTAYHDEMKNNYAVAQTELKDTLTELKEEQQQYEAMCVAKEKKIATVASQLEVQRGLLSTLKETNKRDRATPKKSTNTWQSLQDFFRAMHEATGITDHTEGVEKLLLQKEQSAALKEAKGISLARQTQLVAQLTKLGEELQHLKQFGYSPEQEINKAYKEKVEAADLVVQEKHDRWMASQNMLYPVKRDMLNYFPLVRSLNISTEPKLEKAEDVLVGIKYIDDVATALLNGTISPPPPPPVEQAVKQPKRRQARTIAPPISVTHADVIPSREEDESPTPVRAMMKTQSNMLTRNSLLTIFDSNSSGDSESEEEEEGGVKQPFASPPGPLRQKYNFYATPPVAVMAARASFKEKIWQLAAQKDGDVQQHLRSSTSSGLRASPSSGSN